MDSIGHRRALLGRWLLAVVPWVLGGAAPSGEQRLERVPATLLERALRSVEELGMVPLSAGYAVEPAEIRVSVYAARREQLVEVVFDAGAGTILSSAPLPPGHERNAAESEALVMRSAHLSLRGAVVRARARNRGLPVVGVSPSLLGGRPVAWVTFLDGPRRRQFIQPLDDARPSAGHEEGAQRLDPPR